MKPYLLLLIGVSFVFASFTMQKTSPSSASSKSAVSIKLVNISKSSASWIGKKISGEHSGTVQLSSGTVTVKNGILGGGEFILDMNSIKCTDIKDSNYNAKLVKHLKDDDFFGVNQFPTATLKITKVLKIKNKSNAYNLICNLTVKGITNEITFPATFKKEGNVYVGSATIKVDRTKWGIKYGSSNFFEGLGDKAIKNEFEMKVNIVTN